MTPPLPSSATDVVADGCERSAVLHDIRGQLQALSGLVQLMARGVTHLGQHDAAEVARSSLRSLVGHFERLEGDVHRAQPRR